MICWDSLLLYNKSGFPFSLFIFFAMHEKLKNSPIYIQV